MVCDVDGYDAATNQANAALIAAAPELLAALEVWARFAVNNGWTDKDFHNGDPSNGWISQTKAAIAKARGGAA